MLRHLPFLAILLCVGCGAAKPKTFVPPPPTPLSIRTTPAFMQVRMDVNVYCQLPTDVGEGEYIFGIVNHFQSMGPIDRIQFHRVFRVPCNEKVVVFCGYKEHGKEPKMITRDYEPIGECDASSSQ